MKTRCVNIVLKQRKKRFVKPITGWHSNRYIENGFNIM